MRARLPSIAPSTPLLARIVLASCVLAVLVSVAIAALVLAILSLRDTTDAATRSKDVTAATLELEKIVLDLEASLRGFVVAGDPRFLTPWRAGRADLPGA